MDFEVVIVGGGLAGATAALFSSRHGRTTLCLDAGVGGGQLLSISRVEDYPGFPAVAGFELCPTLQGQAMDAGAEFRAAEIQSIASRDGEWVVTPAGGEEVVASAVIIASGSTPRTLGVPGEERLTGRGISRCASCDGPLHRDEVVVVVGAGDAALQEAHELAEYAARVVVVHRGESLGGQETYRRRVLEAERIEIRYQTVVEEILGDEAVSGVRLRNLRVGAEEELPAHGVFPYIGSVGATSFLSGVLPLDDEGRLWTDVSMRTELPGLLAAGDVRTESVAQAVSVAGDGATAAISAHRYLDDSTWISDAAAQTRLAAAQ